MRKRLKKLIIVAFAGIVSIPMAPDDLTARPLEQHFGSEDSCYGRVYSKAHLRKHPQQRVTEMHFKHFPSTFGVFNESNEIEFNDETGELYFVIDVRFRDTDDMFSNAGTCYPQGDQYRCAIECDGGGFSLKNRSSESVLLINRTGFNVSGCDGENYRSVVPEPDDKVFRLDRLPDQLCVPSADPIQ